MAEYILLGAGFALAAAAQPGPFQAFLFSSVTRNGWKRTLPAALSPLLSDGPIAVLVLFLLNRVPPVMNIILQGVGGLFLLLLAWRGYVQWKGTDTSATMSRGSVPATILQAALVNLLNPNPYLGWSLFLGPAAITAWGITPAYGAALLISFYLTLMIGLAGTIVLFGATGFLSEKRRKTLILVSAVILALLGAYQLIAALTRASNWPGG